MTLTKDCIKNIYNNYYVGSLYFARFCYGWELKIKNQMYRNVQITRVQNLITYARLTKLGRRGGGRRLSRYPMRISNIYHLGNYLSIRWLLCKFSATALSAPRMELQNHSEWDVGKPIFCVKCQLPNTRTLTWSWGVSIDWPESVLIHSLEWMGENFYVLILI